ncbi:hypothetical protein M413DRAFT_32495 [Hebeloma cylindrosporum]|uniref:SCP domain-containing protein n=1 Tax=Hebeloma cylindrosporum TaxID=76867 RepID=A0A0C2Y310_HEBCY|nr:hypothetical protein M413DRAFT_32495 [Hebeloma cylindrosporum h7]
MFISKIFLVLFALLFSFALAAPVPGGSALAAPDRKERSLDVPQLSARGFAHIVQAAKVATQIKKKLKPTPGKAVFWSGVVPHPTKADKWLSVQDQAESWAKANGKETIDPSLKKEGVHMPLRKDNPFTQKLWDFASKVYAKRTSGHVHVVLGTKLREKNTYENIEKPVLLKNKKVTKITEHNAATGEKTVIKGK